ncbi:putative transcriptional regulator YdeE [Paenibacillus sp. W4I10]|nr:putative transcriptional regulator YdeE [Paenibacillus sp. W4I10]
MEMRGLDTQEIGKLWKAFRQCAVEIDDRRNHESIYYALVELTGTEWEVFYAACVEVGEVGKPPAGMVDKVLPPTTYAVFSHKGSIERIQDTIQYIYGTWLPKSGRLRMNQPEFVRYDHRYLGPLNEDSEFDIYIPIGPSVT